MTSQEARRRLEQAHALAHRVALYVPGTSNGNENLDEAKRSSIVDHATMTLCSAFGGATVTEGVGSWVSDSLGLVTERVTVVQSYCTAESLDEGLPAVLSLAERIKVNLQQEAVSLEVDNRLYFI